MSIVYHAKASLVNESISPIARMAVKITEVANADQCYIKTFPFIDYRNRAILNLIRAEMPPYKRNSFLGISFTSYHCINFIEFFSTFKEFQLNKNDTIELHFENGDILNFQFANDNSQYGLLKRNVFPVSDEQLEFITKKSLLHWKITNAQNNNIMYGGFTSQEGNKQYGSEKTGRQLLKKMAKEVLRVKAVLN